MKDFNSLKEKKTICKRQAFLKGINSEALADDFPMYTTRQNLVRFLARYEIFKKILGVKGAIVECGVHHGASLMFFAQLSAMYEPYAFNREVIGFDTFEGFPSVDKKDGAFAYTGDLSDSDLGLIKKSVELFDENRPIGHVQKVRLVKGDAVKTIPQFIKENQHLIVALLYLDFDIYEPTKAALQHFLPRMPKGSIIAFDELNDFRRQGETIALLEFMKLNDRKIEKFPEEPHISYLVL